MSDPTITCPKCSNEIRLTESLAAPLIASTRDQYERKLAQKDEEVSRKEAAVKQQLAEVTTAKAKLDEEVALRLKSERAAIVVEEAKKARTLLGGELDAKSKELEEMQEVLALREEKLAEAQKAQAELLRKQRELDDAKRELDLTIEKRVQESLGEARERAKREAEDELKLKVDEKNQTIAAMQKQIEELKQRAEQGSQQLQGEVQELELENLLRSKFPLDIIGPVPKGEFGGDAIQQVCGPTQSACGTILWESKRTKHWSDQWLPKLREDQRAAKADFAVIVTQALPKDVDAFDCIDKVWVTSPRNIVPMAIALRQSLIDLNAARQASEGQETKMQLVYTYLTGPGFKQRVEAIVEAFSSMQDDLNKEKKAILRQWAKREQQIMRVMAATVGMYGDLQGIAGKSIQEIEGLEMAALPAPNDGFEIDGAETVDPLLN